MAASAPHRLGEEDDEVDLDTIKDPYVRLAREFRVFALHDRVTVYEGAPDGLTFYKEHVAASVPALICGVADKWPAMTRWTWEYLEAKLGSAEITVAVTPDGRADAPLRLGDAARAGLLSERTWHLLKDREPTTMLFVTPYEERMTLSRLAALMRAPDADADERDPRVHYVQLQNDNLRSEWATLLEDVDMRIPFAEAAFGCQPDAVNLWLGDERSTTSLHKDHYENLYVVVSGRKHFTLYPPTDFPFLYEEPCIAAAYRARSEDGRLELEVDDVHASVPWLLVDPYSPDVQRMPRSVHAQPLHVTVEAGQMLYLPALWFHHVQQEPDDTGKCVAVNLWFDMRFGIQWAYYNFMQNVSKLHSTPVM